MFGIRCLPIFTFIAVCMIRCLPAAADGSDVCAFYEQHLEAKTHCGNDGYPLAYGKKYCQRFRDLDGLTPSGSQWRNKTLACLQSKLDSFVKDGGDCEVLRQSAFSSHAACYLDSGFCALPVGDWLRIFHTINWRDLISDSGLRQIGAALRSCYQRKVDSKQLNPDSSDATAIRAIIAALEQGKSPKT